MTFVTPGGERISGYGVGMDDYHWVVVVSAGPHAGSVTLVHKSSSPLVIIGSFDDLSHEPVDLKDRIESIGAKFRAYCKDNYF